MPLVYHDSGVVGCRRYLWRGRDSRSGEQVADSAALVLQLLARMNPDASGAGGGRSRGLRPCVDLRTVSY